jgi:hypothetical protein
MKIVTERGELLVDSAVLACTPRVGDDLKILGVDYRVLGITVDAPKIVVRPFNICAVCGNPREDHHDFVPLLPPKGCVCNPKEWGDPFHIPPVCMSYNYDPEFNTCLSCQHEDACHR